MAGIYIHIPFCSQFCTYCNFYSVKQLGLRERFVQAMVNEIEARKDFFKNIGSSVTTVYIGGGTPSVLLPGQLGRIVEALRRTFDLSGLQEFTIEVNPNDITPEYAAFLTSLGVNRVSMGMQSFEDSHLKWMNRRHTSSEGIQAYRTLREAGINNISLDLIFGYAPLSGQQWENNIDTMISLNPEHISAYQMSIEPGSRLSAMSRNGTYTPPSDEECLKQYTLLQTKLTAAGYHQYEISNFARQKPAQQEPVQREPAQQNSAQQSQRATEHCSWPAVLNTADASASLHVSQHHVSQHYVSQYNVSQHCVSQHNSSYWDGTPYLGLGPAAHSYSGAFSVAQSPGGACSVAQSSGGEACVAQSLGRARRMWNTPSVKKYCSYYCGEGAVDVVGYEDLTLEDIFNETIMLGLRRTRGFSLDSLASLDAQTLSGASLLREIMPDINRLVMSGQLIMEDASSVGGAARGVAATGKNIRIPADKLFISDSIIRELFV